MVTNTSSYDLFDALYPEYQCTKPVRLIEFFGGIGSQAKALERLGVPHEPWKLVEIDKFAVDSYNAIHGTSFTTSDITQIHAEDLNVVSPDKYDYILTWSFPCGVEGTLVTTNRGLIPIEKVNTGDFVIGHDGKWHVVTWSGKTGDKKVYSLRTTLCPETKFTPEHKFYVRKRFYTFGHSWRKKNFTTPEWVMLKDIMKDPENIYCGMPINTNSEIPFWDGIDLNCGSHVKHVNTIEPLLTRKEFWWVIGKYVADGWIKKQGGIVISCGWETGKQGDWTKANELIEKLSSIGVHCTPTNERTSHKVHISYREWEAFVDLIGHDAKAKEIPQFILDLPVELLKAFLDGYLAGDGYKDNSGKWNCATSSEKLAYGLVQIIAKVYHVGAVCRPGNVRGGKCTIEGRLVNYNPFWTITFIPDQKRKHRAFYENGYIWHPVKYVIDNGETLPVYDLTVEDAHSFIANNCIVHNCTSLSVAGLRNGMSEGSGTASSLIWEVKRTLEEMHELSQKDSNYGLPKILLMENVPQVIDSKNVRDLNKMRDFLESIGYTNHLAILKGSDYGVPQARHRAFMVSILGDNENSIYSYQFPLPCGCKWNMLDILSDDFDSKRYVRDSVAHYVCEENAAFNRNTTQKLNEIKLCGRLNSHQAGAVYDPVGISPTLTAGGASSINVLWREHTDEPDSDNFNDPMFFQPNAAEVDVTVLETVEEISDYLFDDTSDSEPDYNKVSDYKWKPVIRDHMQYSIRTFTAKESLMFMDFDEQDYNKAKLVTSNHQMHKQAGNSIVVNCIVALLGQFFPGKHDVYKDIANIPPKDRANYSSK